MKLMLCVLLVVGVSSLALAEVKEVKAKVVEKKLETSGAASDKSSDSKPKRDAPLVGSYHGPSYKYLPPSSVASSYDSYSHGHHGLASAGIGHSSGFGGGYSSSGLGHSSGFGGSYGGHSSSGLGGGGSYSGHSLGHHSGGHHGLASSGHHASGHYGGGSSSGLGFASSGHHSGGHYGGGASSGLGYASLGHHSSGHHGGGSSSGLGYASSGHHGVGSYASSGHGYSGHGSAHHSSGGIKGGSHGFSSGPSYTSTLGHGGYSGGPSYAAAPSYASGHGYSTSGSGSSGIGYKTHTISVPTYSLGAGHVGSSAGANTGYQYSKGISGSIPSASSGFGSGGFGSSHGSEVHHSDHSDHVHNGNQEHHYIVTSGHSAGFGGSQGASAQGGYNYEAPAASYLPPVQQHSLPASSYGVPIATVGEAYNTNYHTQSEGVQVQEQGPSYAAGHKGLGHFGYTASKPQVLHTSFTGSSFKQPAYSKAPFKPSAFLGSKYEGSSHNEAPVQQYLPPTDVGADSTGYDYPIPSGPSTLYQEPNYQTNVEVQATPIHEPESTYLPPNNNEVSYNEIPSDPSASYLPPQQSYGVPYSH